MGYLVMGFRYVQAEKKLEIYLAGADGWVYPKNKAFTVKILNWYGETVVFSSTSQNIDLISLSPPPFPFWWFPLGWEGVGLGHDAWEECFGLLCQFQSREFSVGGNIFRFKIEIDGQTIYNSCDSPLEGSHLYSGVPLV